jgi:hypothetical protein
VAPQPPGVVPHRRDHFRLRSTGCTLNCMRSAATMKPIFLLTAIACARQA